MASFTRNAIKASFVKLLDERPLNQITVKEIVEDCGVNRNSFYYHFADIPALISEIAMENAERIIHENASAKSPVECLDAVVSFILAHKRAVLHIYRSGSRELIEQHLMRICHDSIEAYARFTFGEMPMLPEDREILLRFYQCECFGQTILWLNSGLNYDVSRQFARLYDLREGFAEILAARCRQRAQAALPADPAEQS